MVVGVLTRAVVSMQVRVWEILYFTFREGAGAIPNK